MVKNIVNDWQKQFPILSPYTPSTLYAKAGIILIGLRLDKVMSDTLSVDIRNTSFVGTRKKEN